jgi:hypothetical protein
MKVAKCVILDHVEHSSSSKRNTRSARNNSNSKIFSSLGRLSDLYTHERTFPKSMYQDSYFDFGYQSGLIFIISSSRHSPRNKINGCTVGHCASLLLPSALCRIPSPGPVFKAFQKTYKAMKSNDTIHYKLLAKAFVSRIRLRNDAFKPFPSMF